MLGSGWQAGGQLLALAQVRQLSEIRVFSPNREHLTAFCAEIGREIGAEVIPADSAEAALRDADLVVAATNSMNPVVRGEWLQPGVHLERDQAMGGRRGRLPTSGPHGDQRALGQRGRSLTVDVDPRQIPYLAEGALPYNWAGMDELPELADLATGRCPGRTSPNQITFFMNNIGIGIQSPRRARPPTNAPEPRASAASYPTNGSCKLGTRSPTGQPP